MKNIHTWTTGYWNALQFTVLPLKSNWDMTIQPKNNDLDTSYLSVLYSQVCNMRFAGNIGKGMQPEVCNCNYQPRTISLMLKFQTLHLIRPNKRVEASTNNTKWTSQMLYYIIGVIANEKCPPLFQDLFQKKHGFVLLNVPLTNYMSYLVY